MVDHSCHPLHKALRRNPPFKVAAIYACFSLLWILFSDQLLLVFIKDPDLLTTAQIFKGWTFVLVTSLLIYLFLQREIGRLKQSEEVLRATLHSTADGVLVTSEQGEILASNARFAEMWNIPSSLRTTREDRKLLESVLDKLRDPEQFVRRVEELYCSSEDAMEEIHLQDGRVFERFTTPLAQAGMPAGRVWNFRDITERVRSEQVLRDKEQRYRTLFETAGDAIFIMQNEIFLDCNSKTLEIFRCRAEEILGQCPFDFSPPIQPDGSNSRDKAMALISMTMAGHPQSFEWKHQRLDGELFDAEVSLNSVTLGENTFIQAIVRDVSERKQEQEALRHAQKMEAMGTLAGGIAHDFNNILGSIMGFTELARGDVDEPKTLQEDLQQIHDGAERARNLVKQILTFSRQTEQDKYPLQVSLILKEAMKLMRSSIPTTIDIKQDIASEAAVQADPTQIHQVIMNLCTNAYQAMRQSGGILAVGLKEVEISEQEVVTNLELPGGRYLQLEVSDTGHGIDPAVKQKIFEPYYTTKEPGEGTGLGLAVVHGIVQDHQGAINVYSEPGKGTTFRVYLPIVFAQPLDIKKDTVHGPLTGGHEHIMIVDDEERITRISRRILERFGYRVSDFTEPAKGFEAFSRTPQEFDLLLTDMTMPLMTGAELAAKIFAIRADMPVVLCTGHSEMINRETALAMGIVEYCEKPVPMEHLVRTVRTVLDAQKESGSS